MNDKEHLSERGLFWLPGNDDKKVWGTLHVNEVGEAKVETFGALLPEWNDGQHRIVGKIKGGSEFVTLTDCFPVSTPVTMGEWDDEEDWSQQTCFVNAVIEGVKFDEGEEISFEQATVEISNLPKWTTPRVVELTFLEEGIKRSGVTVSKYEKPDETTRVCFEGNDIEVTIRFLPKENWGTSGSVRHYSIEDHCYLVIQGTDGNSMSLDEVVSVAGAIQDLLCVCCNETSAVTSLNVRCEKEKWPSNKAYVPMRGNTTERKESNSRPALSFNDIGRMTGVINNN